MVRLDGGGCGVSDQDGREPGGAADDSQSEINALLLGQRGECLLLGMACGNSARYRACCLEV